MRFPHEVHNAGEANRVHLVMDLLRNESLDALLQRADCIGRGRLFGYYARHWLRMASR